MKKLILLLAFVGITANAGLFSGNKAYVTDKDGVKREIISTN